jgi:hypothetical protein
MMLALPVMSIELFRYQGFAKDGGTLEYVFEAGEQNSPSALTKEKAAEIAAAGSPHRRAARRVYPRHFPVPPALLGSLLRL